MVRARQTGNKYAEIPYISFTEETDKPPVYHSFADLMEYRCSLELYNVVHVRNEKDLEYQMHRVRRQLAEQLYGEFRQMLLSLHEAISLRDNKKAMEIADNIWNIMFGETND
jgi:hypothetical protein